MDLAEALNAVTHVPVRTDFKDYVPTHGVSINFILSYLTNIRGVDTMRDLESYTLRITDQFNCSFAELLLAHPGLNTAVNDTANFFVSFAYDTKLSTLVDALNRYRSKIGAQDIYVWISILSVNQHFQATCFRRAPIVYPKTWFKNAFETSIGTIQRVLFIMNPIHNPIALQRLWCIYELYLTVAIPGCSLDVCMSAEDESVFMNGLLEDTQSILNYIDAIDAESARASPRQEQKLRERIKDIPGGYATLNHQVRTKLRSWFATTAELFLANGQNLYQADRAKYIRFMVVVCKLFSELGLFQNAERIGAAAVRESVTHYGNDHEE